MAQLTRRRFIGSATGMARTAAFAAAASPWLAIIATPVHAGEGAETVNAYFEKWLKARAFTAFERHNDGIVFTTNGTRLDGDINDSRELTPGKSYVVESRVSLTLPDGRRIDDFVAGAGSDMNAAIADSLQNLCLTTLDPIYAELFDHDDPNVRKETWSVRGSQRRIFLSDWGQRGEHVDDGTRSDIERMLAESLKDAALPDAFHWVKVVAARVAGGEDTMVVTIDGVPDDALSQRVAGYPWPTPDQFYVDKLFLVIGARQ
mgnify:CR=1 FL=1